MRSVSVTILLRASSGASAEIASGAPFRAVHFAPGGRLGRSGARL